MATITGRKGGGSNPRTPVESPDSLQSIATAKILLALGEGEFAGAITAKDIFLDGTPIQSDDGTMNFPGVTWEFRPGTQTQEYIQGVPAVENETTVSTELKASQPWTKAISNTQLSAVRIRIGVPTLQRQLDNGDVVGYRVDYRIDLSVDGGGYYPVLNAAFDGKTTTLYERSHRIDLPKASTGWQIRLVRLTPDSTSSRIAATTNIEAFAEVIDAKLRYPNTALIFVTFDAKQFNNIPQISVGTRGRVIRVPSSYDPVSRTYSGTWDGSFKWAYSNNPAWVFYDLLLNERFGLGDRINATQVDKWELYRIAQYCDQPVPDGRGGSGTEPRFLCDVYIQSQNEAFTVLRDLASIFRGMTYWSSNQVVAIADMPADSDERNYIYTRANVINGKFKYSSGSERDRNSTTMVSWSNPDNHYADDIEAVVEQDLVRRYGVRQAEITAIGCTRRTEANRRGRWALLTNAKDRLITFRAGLDGYIPQPGRIIYVADQYLSGRIMGGRVSAVNGRIITLDRIPDAVAGDRLLVNLPSGKSEARTIQAVNARSVTVSAAWSMPPEPEAVWSIDAQDIAIQQYRVTSVKDNGDNTFIVTGVFHNPDKYAAIDSGARLDERPISAIPPGVQAPPAEVSIESYSRVVQGLSVETMRVSWPATEHAIAYECQWRKDNGDWINAPRTSTRGFEIEGIYSGRYTARVRAVNASDISSVWTTSVEVTLTGKIGQPPVPINFRTAAINWGIQIDWNFPDGAEDSLMTEIQYSAAFDGSDPLLLADVPYPSRRYTQLGLKAGQVFWYRARIIDRIGNQSDWTGWVRGMANDNADDYLGDITGDFLTSKDGAALKGDIDTNLEAALQNALANHGTVEHQYQQLGAVRADILVVKTTIAEVDKAMAELSTTVQAQIEDVTATLEDKLTAIVDADGATAIHTLKAGVRINDIFYSAGMSIAVLAQAGQPVVTRIGFNANQLVLMSGSGDTQFSPFAVVDGQVFMNSAFIKDGSIDNGKIGNFIQSNNFVDGVSGWRWDKNGTMQNYGSDGTGAMKQTNVTTSIRDANRLRVQIGKITGVF
ncbi:host specificity protein J [Cedecea neteri]|uniref:host specificity protein J n=1 Tax=Cedecea neteri TaxID=158822 RepID=UPI002AA70841|nr:host specificity protein J [Cedecea neteri]WPU24521.1 host specificity protein J [Cedecea neteri]